MIITLVFYVHIGCLMTRWDIFIANHVSEGHRAFTRDHFSGSADSVSAVSCSGEAKAWRPPFPRPHSDFGLWMPGCSSVDSGCELASVVEGETPVVELSSRP